MGLTDLFKSKPKWQNQDPDIRLEAVKGIEDKSIIELIAEEDDDYRVRRAAVMKITDKAVLLRIIGLDNHVQVRLTAIRRIHNENDLLIIALHNGEESVEIAAVEKLKETASLRAVVNKSHSVAVRVAAVKRISDPDLLAEIVIQARCEKTRLAAIKEITAPEVLTAMALRTKYAPIRLEAVRKLQIISPESFDDKTRVLSEPFKDVTKINDPEVLKPYFKALENIVYPKALAVIAEGNGQDLVRWEAISKMEDLEVITRIALNDESNRVRMAATALVNDPSILIKIAMNDEHPWVRMKALERIQDTRTLVALCEKNEDIRVRITAVACIKATPGFKHIAAKSQSLLARFAAQCRLDGKSFLDEMIQMFSKSFYSVRVDGAQEDSGAVPYPFVEVAPVFKTNVLGILCELDLPQEAAGVIKAQDNPEELQTIATKAANPLTRLLAVEKINAPSILMNIVNTCSRAPMATPGLKKPADDLALYAVLEKLGNPAFLPWAKFDSKYVEKIQDKLLLISLTQSEFFQEIREAAEKRFLTLLKKF